MTRDWFRFGPLVVIVALAQCAAAVADDESLRDSFAEQIATSSFVTDFARTGNELMFVAPDSEGRSAPWRVRIASSLVESNEFDEGMPYQGHITSEWYVNEELVEYVGSVTALPNVFLDRGLGQECWAYWWQDELRWDW